MTDDKPIEWEEPGPPVKKRLLLSEDDQGSWQSKGPATLADIRAALEPMGLRVVEASPSSEVGHNRYKARAEELEKALWGLVDACDRLMGDTDLDYPEDPPQKAMRAALAALDKAGK